MQQFTKTDKMVFLIQSNHHLLPVIHRFGIRLGFGNKTVEEVCKKFKVNTDFFLSIVNTFSNKNYFPEKKLLSFSPLLIIDYLKKTHRYYISYSLPQIEGLMHEFLLSTLDQNKEMRMIEEFYLKYKNKLLLHIQEEEENVFPFVEKLVKNPGASQNKNFNPNFEEEHELVDFELDDLKNIILKYISPDYDDLVCNKLLFEIYHFEKDIHDHARLEDAILIPQIEQLQK
jgi:regulator of cell morphogenesis and NO signaling